MGAQQGEGQGICSRVMQQGTVSAELSAQQFCCLSACLFRQDDMT